MNVYQSVLGNINDHLDTDHEHHHHNEDHVHIEKVILNQDDLLKKMIVATTDHHEEITIALKDNTKLKDGDIIFNDGHRLIYVVIDHDKLIEISPQCYDEMGYVAHNLGNRHIPCQFLENKIYLVYDPLIESWLKKNSYKYAVVTKKLDQPFKYANLS